MRLALRSWIALSALTLLSCDSKGAPEVGDHVRSNAQARVSSLEQVVDDIRDLYNAPGVSVGIARRDSVEAGGFGLRQWNRDVGVDAHTSFPIYSVTKVYLGLAIARLADAGRLSFDDRVTKWIPNFSVADKSVVERATVRHLLAHSIGVESADFWLENVPGVTLDEVIARIANQPQAKAFGAFYYSDTETNLLAKVIEEASGMSWGAAVKTWVLEPMDLENTYMQAHEFAKPGSIVPTGDGWGTEGTQVGMDAVAGARNIAPPQAVWPDGTERLVRDERERGPNVLPFQSSPIDPAQSAYSSAHDMAKLAQMLLNEGVHEGDVFVSKAAFFNLIKPVIEFSERPAGGTSERLRWRTASAGPFLLYDVHGQDCFGHTGGSLGAEADLLVCPGLGIGTYVGTTGSLYIGGAGSALVDHIFSKYLGRDDDAIDAAKKRLRDTVESYAEYQREFDLRLAEIRTDGAPMEKLESYIGRYEDGFAGTLNVVMADEGALVASLGPGAIWDLTPLADDTFLATWKGPRRSRTLHRFSRGSGETINAVTLPPYGGGVTVTLRRIQ
ncbi:MAG: serine hydrolase domain-containing protein [Pseudomonadota bacterium]